MAIADRKRREREQRGKDILDVAESLFFARDHEDVSMESIANKAELNKATLYLYYKNKESLLFAVVLRGVRILAQMVREAASGEDEGREKLAAIWSANLRFRRERPEYARLYDRLFQGRFSFDSVSDLRLTPMTALNFADQERMAECEDAVLKELLALRREMLSVIQDAIEKGMKDRAFRRGLDPVMTAIIITRMMDDLPNVPSDHLALLSATGIDVELYAQGVWQMIDHMVSDR